MQVQVVRSGCKNSLWGPKDLKIVPKLAESGARPNKVKVFSKVADN